jgi:methionyl-tRNA formyltransferase
MSKSKYVILSEKSWNNNLVENLSNILPEDEWIQISKKEDFSLRNLNELSPSLVFVPHWSYIIPEEIYTTFDCIVFHMTDLPFGRGGSPLQNLILRGFKKTKVSALKVTQEIDAGPVYTKAPLSLEGRAQDIFVRCNQIILEMIIEIVTNNPKPLPQTGEVVHFKRRKREEGDIANLTSLEKVYDYIRMLDAEGYPNAFIELDHFTLEFSQAKYDNKNSIVANVRIIKK